MDSEPFTISRSYVHVDGAEIIVLLMSGGSSTRDLHVQLYGIHPLDGVADVREEICLGARHLRNNKIILW